MRRKYIIYTIAAIVFIIAASVMSGCLTNQLQQKERWINQVYIEMNLNFSEIESINFTEARAKLETMNFTIENNSGIGYYYRSYTIQRLLLVVHFHADATNGSQNAAMEVLYSATFKEAELGAEKKYITEQVDKVADACNITLNWSIAVWSVQYQDSD
jgi:hypothetical protein